MTARLPVLFLGHGSPMNAIEDNAWSRAWAGAGRRAAASQGGADDQRPLGDARGQRGQRRRAAETIHDFGGFPQALFDVRYDAPGDPALAAGRRAAVARSGGAAPDPRPGPRRLGRAAADVSGRRRAGGAAEPGSRPPDRWHYEAGKRLAALRDEGVLIIGSGDIVHNLRAADFRTGRGRPTGRRDSTTRPRP
jgi:4,5-DOPA dioxygenase extradiol